MISDPCRVVPGQVPLAEDLYKHVYIPETAEITETANLAWKTLSLDNLN